MRRYGYRRSFLGWIGYFIGLFFAILYWTIAFILGAIILLLFLPIIII